MTTLYVLDTDTASYFIRGRHPALDARVAATPAKNLCISAVTRGELLYGLQLKGGAHRLTQVVEQFLLQVQCLPWDAAAATHFGRIAAQLHKAGTPIGAMDAMIAGHAAALGAVLVTNNASHFGRVENLVTENWLRES
jgi:tRNA(fMet)-specific endonuclease VapC